MVIIKKSIVLFLLIGLTLAVQAEDKKTGRPGRAAIGAIAASATVESIDYKTRYVTLKVGPAARNFDRVRKGDHVYVQYVEALMISVNSPQG